MFHFSLWLKLSIFFSLVLLSLEMHNRSRKKLPGKKLNANIQFSKDVLFVTLLQEEVRQYQILGKIATHFPYFHLLHPLSSEDFYVFHLPPFNYNFVFACPPSF